MIVLFKDIKQENVLVFDAEYNQGFLIQFAGVLFKKIQDDLFQISKSINFYVKLDEGEKINYFIERFTGITDEYLEENGIYIEEAEEKIDEFLSDVNDLMIVSHGLKNDRITLDNNGIDLYTTNERTIYPYCTYKAAKRILKRDKKLNLKEVALEAGLFLSHSHNAFDDVVAGIAVFSLLCKLDSEEDNEKIL